QSDQVAFEVSSLNDHDAGNGIHILSTEDGTPFWDKDFAPGMNHRRQARAMYLSSGLWIVHGGKTNTVVKEDMKRLPIQVSSLDPLTGKTMTTHDAGLAHCFPPVATPYYMFAGVLDMTDLNSGKVIANPITKANCSQENGWVPANGLVYTSPKHCTCWPMLRGYVSMAPKSPNKNIATLPLDQIQFPIERGAPKDLQPASQQAQSPSDWPTYRSDRWRSGSTSAPGPKTLDTLWSSRLASKVEVALVGDAPLGPILHDWRDNPVIKSPLTPPTIANGLAYIARGNAHEVLALDASNGDVRWRFTADGRVDTPPTIHKGLCLFGSASGHVYALNASTGKLVWRLQAAPTTERIVAYGQVESPWPVAGTILVIDDVIYFAAGRQPFADGGVLIFAIDPTTGERHWVHRIDTIPQKGYYENSGLEFDPYDIMHQEGDRITMSRWILTKDGKKVEVDKWNAFALLNTGKGKAYVPRGTWTYGARHQHRFPGEAKRRPLSVFRDSTIYSSLNGTTEIFRRDFDLDNGDKFSPKWITGWAAAGAARKGEKPYRSYRLAEKAAWKADHHTSEEERSKEIKKGTQLYNNLYAMALSGDDKLYIAHKDGRLKTISTKDGSVLAERTIPQPAWDGLAIANQRLFLTTQTGELLCLGE
ncbi:PQQ-binding-like beta-propeller repeat protein, partial [bacterium]|nr:PQQ-binding-like beta-propeller repeat protein [bacterium]